MPADAVRTTCPYCGVGCGVLATRQDGGLKIEGDPDHPANLGRLCVKGAALGETIGLEGRLLHPEIGGRRVGWERALDHVASGFARTIERYGPDSVAFYVSGQLLTEDYYVANKLMKGFIGSANIDTNSRLCMSSSVAGHVRAFGSDTVPGCYEDLEEADLVVLVGSNAAWCHPVLFRRIEAARAIRPSMRLVVIDPRRTDTAESADLFLPLKPGSDVALFNGLLAHLARSGAADADFLAAHTEGAEAALAATGDEDTALACDLDPADLALFYDWFAGTEKVVTVYSQGVNQSSSGTDKVNAIINCHLLTGRIGRPGMGPLSFTGQPNAMGGREAGGLANTLAAHMGFDDGARDRLGRFWAAPRVAPRPGLKAVDLFKAIDAGRIKALWIMATNPAVSMPDASLVRRALDACPFVVLSDCMAKTDTARHAHVKLPALAWAEKEGTVTNSERRISRQRAVLAQPGEARPDWWIVCQVAKRMGFADAFAFESPAAVFNEYARLTAFENGGRRDLDLSGLVGADYDRLQPVQWPVRKGGAGTARLFGTGGFYHPDARARLVPTRPRPTALAVGPDWPFLLNSGRTRDHWHTMTRTGKSPRLASHREEPWLSIHPKDAARQGFADRQWVRIESPKGRATLRLMLDPGQREGELFAPMHWNDGFAADAVIGGMIAGHVDPFSGQPELKATPVRLKAFEAAWEGILACREEIEDWEPGLLWTRIAGRGHLRYRLAGETAMADWPGWVRRRIGSGNWIDYRDARLGLYRAALFRDGHLAALLFVAPAKQPPEIDALDQLFARAAFAAPERADLLAGHSARREDQGPIVCACHQVGRNRIQAAIAEAGLTDVGAIGAVTRAGTNCGSCLPELKRLLAENKSLSPAALSAG